MDAGCIDWRYAHQKKMKHLLSTADVQAELGAKRVAQPYLVAQDPTVPLSHLTDRQFELLAQLLLDADSPGQHFYDSAHLLTYGADEGRDVVLYKQELPVGVVQCKRYARSIGVGDVLEELFKFLLFALRDRSLMPQARDFRYEFWTARELTKDAGKFFKEPTSYFQQHASDLTRYVAAARKACKALRQPSPYGVSHDDEEREAIAIARGLQFLHVGQTAISRRLSAQVQVRKWFFRGPDDTPSSPSVAQTGVLVERLMCQAITRFTQSGNLDTESYVPSAGLAREFADFLESGDRVFVLTGGSGHGKTTWAARLLASPPPGWEVLLIKGEDLLDTDVNIGQTLARLLTAHPMPTELTGSDMTAAVCRWLDAANRLLLVDGLDRVPAQARAGLKTWIENSLDVAAGWPARLILMSRTEEWRGISGRVMMSTYQLYRLGLLSDDEAAQLYHAYGLPPVRHQRPLRTPSLIRRLARLTGEVGGPVSRARLLETSVGEYRDALAHDHGKLQTERAFSDLSRALAASADARVRAQDFEHDGTITILDVLIRQDVLVSDGRRLRPESDDLAEYMTALELDWRKALAEVESGRTDSIFLGAIAIAPQLAGREAELAPLLEAVLPRIGEVTGMWHDLAARIMIEVEDHARHLHVLQAIFEAWKWNNVVLYASSMHELLEDLRLPIVDRFALLMRLAHGEDEDDWRLKFWRDPELSDRMVTPFARTICDLVRAHPAVTLPPIEALLGQAGGGLLHAVALALLFEAAAVALPDTLLCCTRIGPVGEEVTADLAYLYPLGFAHYALGRARAAAASIDGLVDNFCRAFRRAVTEDAEPETVAQFADIVDALLSLGASDRARLRLLLCSLTAAPEPRYLDELLASLNMLDWSDIWWLVNVSGEVATIPLRAIFSGELTANVSFIHLSRIDPAAIQAEHWPLVATLLAETAASADEVARGAASQALELILRWIERESEDVYRAFMASARRLAADGAGSVRAPMLYYGLSSRRRRRAPAYIRTFREELVDILARAEDGSTLDILRRKLHETNSDDARNVSILADLDRRFGSPSQAQQELYDLCARMRWMSGSA